MKTKHENFRYRPAVGRRRPKNIHGSDSLAESKKRQQESVRLCLEDLLHLNQIESDDSVED